jgi:hypothetical protein
VYAGEHTQIKRVNVIQFGGTIAEKILVEDRGDVLVVTTEEEWAASVAENRPPISVGFKREYLVENRT